MPIKAVVCSGASEDKKLVKFLIATSDEDWSPVIIEVNTDLLCAKYCDVVSGLRPKKLVIPELLASVSKKVAFCVVLY